MYKPSIKSTTPDKVKARLNIVVYFAHDADPTKDFSNTFSVALYTTEDNVKRMIKEYIAEIEAGEVLTTALPKGDLDISTTDISVSQERINFGLWLRKKHKLDKVNELITLGALDGSEIQVVALKKEVKDDFLTAYLKYLG